MFVRVKCDVANDYSCMLMFHEYLCFAADILLVMLIGTRQFSRVGPTLSA